MFPPQELLILQGKEGDQWVLLQSFRKTALAKTSQHILSQVAFVNEHKVFCGNHLKTGHTQIY